jgi:type VI secretion system secreted protein Hcp
MFRTILPRAVLAACLALPCAAGAAVDYFLKIDGVDGESTDAGHKGEINIESWSWGASSTSASGGARAGKACVSAFNFAKLVDKASPILMANAVNGMVMKSAVLTARKAGDKPLEYLKVTLENVLVSSYQGAGSSGAVPMESFALNFTKMTVEYRTQRQDGSLGDPTTASFQGGC